MKDIYGYLKLYETHRTFDTPGKNKPVAANIEFSCDKTQVEERCYGTKKISRKFDINSPVVKLIPKFEVGFCDVQFDYDFVARPDYDLEDQVEYDIISQLWDFGDGNTSNMKAPNHVYNTFDIPYEVNLTVQYRCPPCDWATEFERIEETTFEIPLDVILQVNREETVEVIDELISSQASTLKSAWPLMNNNQDLAGLHPYHKGSAGVWKSSESYAYNTSEEARSTTVNVDLKRDGTYTGHHFNHKSLLRDQIFDWVQTKEVTLYNSRSNAVENVDILEVYDAAVYDLSQQQPIAVGKDMKRSELAFTSFEENRDGYEGNFFYWDGHSYPGENLSDCIRTKECSHF